MDILGGLGAANAVLGKATDFVREIKRPKLSSQDFADVLRTQLALQADAQHANLTRGEAVAQQFMLGRDLDGDSLLTPKESGLAEDVFGMLDANGDGMLSMDELRAPLAAIAQCAEPSQAREE